MQNRPLFQQIDHRISRDREEGDYAYFNALSLKLEYLTKIVTAGVVSCLGDDADRHRYTLEHKLVRADSLGIWTETLDAALVGPPAQVLLLEARDIARDFTELVSSPDWRYIAVSKINTAAIELGGKNSLGTRTSLRKFFEIGVQLRNRSRGHGAPTTTQCHKACPNLEEAIEQVVDNCVLFRRSWAHLRKNFSGKYRVLPLLNDTSVFNQYKSAKNIRTDDGVYIALGNNSSTNNIIQVPLVFADPDIADISLPNGNFKKDTFEILSYVSNDTERQDGSLWLSPPDRLPPSETEGDLILDIKGNVFTNMPTLASDHITRIEIEKLLSIELHKADRHPIISLTGPGGIGKTTTAIAVVEKLARERECLYDVVLWISARDIDLLESGPKPVSRRVFSQRDISRAVVELLEPDEKSDRSFNAERYFEKCLASGTVGPTLFVLDNFETLQNPVDVVEWIDAHIRPPNKVLITTRFRDFRGDYPIEIGGMSENEATSLIDHHAERLGITKLLTKKYVEGLIEEADGHPYVMKILLGEIAKQGKALTPKRIVATADRLLDALFERTYSALGLGSQRVFLLLCSWRVIVPEIAVEAVSLRPNTERFDVKAALDELYRFSLIDRTVSDDDNSTFVGVPLAASMFGQRELSVSPFKVAIEEDRKLLIEFGAGKKHDARRGVFPRIENLFKSVAERVSDGLGNFDEDRLILEFLATHFPKAYLLLADLCNEVDESGAAVNLSKNYIRKFLQSAELHEKKDAWRRLAKLCRTSEDAKGEVQALCELALLLSTNQDELGDVASHLNNRLRDLKSQGFEEAWSGEVRELILKVIEALERHLSDLTATNCSRLAWLYLNVGNEGRAYDITRTGVDREPSNEHCQKLVERLENSRYH